MIQNPKARKALVIGAGIVLVLGVTGVLAGDQIVQLLTALFGAAFGG